MSLHDASEITRRLARLESEAKKLRMLTVVLVAFLTLGTIAPGPKEQEILRAQRIELLDAGGLVRGVLEVDDGGRGTLRLTGRTESALSLTASMIELADGSRSAAVIPGEFQAYQRGVGAALLQSKDGGPLLTLVNRDLEPELFAGRFPIASGETTDAIFGVFRNGRMAWTSPGR